MKLLHLQSHAKPCNSATAYEQFIVAHREDIIDFLKARASKIARMSERESKLVSSL